MKESAVPTKGERRTRVHTDILAPGPAQAMLGLLDRDPRAISEGDPLPLGWHWLYFRQPCRASRLASDGHEVRGDFMPDVNLPRRMWAGGILRSLRPVALGEPAELRSEIASITEKHGRSGRLVFVTVGHTVLQEGRRCVQEEQVIVYRGRAPRPDATTPRPRAARRKTAPGGGGGDMANSGGGSADAGDAGDVASSGGDSADAAGAGDAVSSGRGRADPAPEWTETFLPTTVTLFQFSALTYNSHRIHYDHPYVTQQEGYPGLLVHGPLTALLLLDAAQRHAPAPVSTFRYRALAPLFVDQPITLAGQAAPAGADGSGPREERIVEALSPSGEVALRGWVTSSSVV